MNKIEDTLLIASLSLSSVPELSVQFYNNHRNGSLVPKPQSNYCHTYL
jgi:hypothetical protein